MSGPLRPPSRPGIAVAVLKNLGSRLSQPERPPYDAPEHDVEVNFDDPTGDLIPRLIPTSNEKKQS